MNMLKWLVSATLFLAFVSCDEVYHEIKAEEVHNDFEEIIGNKLKLIQFNSTDLAKIFPNQKDKLNSILRKLPTATDKEIVAVLNDYTDECLELLNRFLMINSVDPLPLEDMITGFEFRFLFITYWAEMSLKNGWLQGAATMERRSDVTLKYEYPNLIVYASGGFNKLLFNYDYLIQFMGLGPKGGVDGSVTNSRYTFELTINLTNLRANLDKFKLNTLGKVSLRFNGYIWFDWFVNLCVKVALIGVKPILRLVIQGFVSSLLNGMCDIYNNVICQVLGDCPGEFANLVQFS